MLEPYILEKNGKQYMYRSSSHYSAKKKGPVADTEYMGTVINGKLKPKRGYYYNEQTKEFGPIEKETKTDDTPNIFKVEAKRYGDSYFLNALQKRLDIQTDLEAAFGKEIGDRILAVAMAYTIQPAAMMHMESVIEKRCIRELLDIELDEDFSSPRMTELTREIGQDAHGRDIFFSRRITGTEGEYVFDLTSESTYSVHNSLAEWGRNKDHLRIRQINFGLVTDKAGKPLMFYIYPGSVADVTTLKRMVSDVKRLGGKDGTLVVDRGFESAGNVKFLLENDMDFVMPMIAGENNAVKSMVTDTLANVGDVQHTKVFGGKSYTVTVRQMNIIRDKGANEDERDTVWDNPDGFNLILDTDEGFNDKDDLLDVFIFRDTEAAGREVASMDVALDSIINKLNGKRPKNPEKSLQKVAGSLANMLQWKMTDEGMKVEVKQNAHTFAANRKGIFIMITPAKSRREWKDVLKCYECRDKVEDAFLEDKSEGDGRTPRSGNRECIVGRTFIRMVSMIMRMEILNRISEVAEDTKYKSDLKPRDIAKRSPISLLDSLSNIELIKGEGWQQLTEVTKDNRLIFRMFDIGPPKGIQRS